MPNPGGRDTSASSSFSHDGPGGPEPRQQRGDPLVFGRPHRRSAHRPGPHEPGLNPPDRRVPGSIQAVGRERRERGGFIGGEASEHDRQVVHRLSRSAASFSAIRSFPMSPAPPPRVSSSSTPASRSGPGRLILFVLPQHTPGFLRVQLPQTPLRPVAQRLVLNPKLRDQQVKGPRRTALPDEFQQPTPQPMISLPAELTDQLVDMRPRKPTQPLETVFRQLWVMPPHQPHRLRKLVTHHRRLTLPPDRAATLSQHQPRSLSRRRHGSLTQIRNASTDA